MRIAYIKTNVEASGYVIHGLGLLSSIAKLNGHSSIFANPAVQGAVPMDVDCVAITCCSDAFPLTCEVAKTYKQHNPKLPIWVGGPHPTFAPGDFDNLSYFDYVVRGDGEDIWNEFTKEGIPPKERLLCGNPVADIDQLPFVDRNQEQDYYAISECPPRPLHRFPGPYRCVLAGRGCRYNCSFCVLHQPEVEKIDALLGKEKPWSFQTGFAQHRKRSVDLIIKELSECAPFGSLFIHDDNLTEAKQWCEEFCAKWDGRPFLMQGRADLMFKNPDVMQRMVDGGLRAMLIGFESGSTRMLKYLRKGTTREINVAAARMAKKLGILVQANMMFGLPTETKEDVESTIDFIKSECDGFVICPSIYTPYPGSDLAKIIVDKGWSEVEHSYEYQRGAGGRKLKEYEAFDYSYSWLYRRLNEENIYKGLVSELTHIPIKNLAEMQDTYTSPGYSMA